MMMDRRALLVQILTASGAVAAQNQDHAHGAAEPPAAKSPPPPHFNPDQYHLLRTLCQFIIPPDEKLGGALEAQAPEFIDLLASENAEYARQISGGLQWIDSWCKDRYAKPFVDCAKDEQISLLDLIAYRENAVNDSSLSPGVTFFAFLRNLTLDGFFTSRIGIDYLQFRGNSALPEFRGCPSE